MVKIKGFRVQINKVRLSTPPVKIGVSYTRAKHQIEKLIEYQKVFLAKSDSLNLCHYQFSIWENWWKQFSHSQKIRRPYLPEHFGIGSLHQQPPSVKKKIMRQRTQCRIKILECMLKNLEDLDDHSGEADDITYALAA